MTYYEIIRNDLNKSDWEITRDKCHSTRAHGQHLAANRKPENKPKPYCTSVHLRIIEIQITLMYQLSAVTLMPLDSAPENICRYVRLCQWKKRKSGPNPTNLWQIVRD